MTDGSEVEAPVDQAIPDGKAFEDLISFDWDDDHVLQVIMKGRDAAQRVYGSESDAVNQALLHQGLSALSKRELEEGSLDARSFIPAIVREAAPQDAFERMLVLQMAITHVAMIRSGRNLARAEEYDQFDLQERTFNKLARTYTTQMEALRKHRNGGKQTVTVQHVNVEDGGQAIVGNVQSGGRGKYER